MSYRTQVYLFINYNLFIYCPLPIMETQTINMKTFLENYTLKFIEWDTFSTSVICVNKEPWYDLEVNSKSITVGNINYGTWLILDLVIHYLASHGSRIFTCPGHATDIILSMTRMDTIETLASVWYMIKRDWQVFTAVNTKDLSDYIAIYVVDNKSTREISPYKLPF